MIMRMWNLQTPEIAFELRAAQGANKSDRTGRGHDILALYAKTVEGE
jgi:hypothetical protein